MWTPYTDEDIYSFYLGEYPVEGNKYISPFRNDGINPSMSFYYFNGKMFWTDFGGIEIEPFVEKRDGLGFVMQIEGIKSRSEADSFVISKILTSTKEGKKEFTPRKKLKKEPHITVRQKWTEEEYQYFSKLSFRLIKERRIYPCDEYYSDSTNKWKCENLGSKSGSPSYLYVLDVENKIWKLYRPKDRDGNKWKSSKGIKNIIEGYEFIPQTRQDIGIITSSMKDSITCMTYLENVYAFNPCSENGNWYAIEKMARDINARFRNIWIWLDADKTGLKNTKMLQNITGWNAIYMPLWFKDNNCKDQFDIISKSPIFFKDIWSRKKDFINL